MNLGLYILLGLILIFLLSLLYRLYILDSKCIHNHDNRYHKIFDNLYLGNIESARNIETIKKLNIKYIFNISNGIPNYFSYDKNIKYFNLFVADDLSDNSINLMTDNLPQLVKELDNCINANDGNILVHCYAGRQRSAILIAGYLAYKFHNTPNEAYDFIIDKRPEAFHYGSSYNFHNSLEKYYNGLYPLPRN
jgi:protein-tyrosine phosphatase